MLRLTLNISIMFNGKSCKQKIEGFQIDLDKRLRCPFLASLTSTLYQPAQHASRSMRYQ
jgi:hypothetical protein